jgi:ABC-type phosphate transport system substrate-binding protein
LGQLDSVPAFLEHGYIFIERIKSMKQFKAWLMPSILIAGLFAFTGSAVAGVVAIVNKANTAADKETIGRLYTGTTKSWSDGTRAKLFDLSDESEREAFCQAYTGKGAGAIKSAWAQAVFSGRGVPPKVLDSDVEVMGEVAKDKSAVGYVDQSSVDGSVRVVR